MWDAHCPVTVLPPPACSNDAAGGPNDTNEECVMHSASRWCLRSCTPSSSLPSALFPPCLLLVISCWLTAPVGCGCRRPVTRRSTLRMMWRSTWLTSCDVVMLCTTLWAPRGGGVTEQHRRCCGRWNWPQ
jgi:hypothetical protein